MNRTVRLTLDWPPSVNESFWYGRGRVGHKKAYKDYRDYAAMHLGQCLPDWCPFTCYVALEAILWPPDRIHRDIDNILKVLLDALQGAGMYKDDYLIQELVARRMPFTQERAGKVDITVEPI